MSVAELSARLQQHLPAAACAVLTLALLLQLGALALPALAAPGSLRSADRRSLPVPELPGRTAIDLGAITASHLFGVAPSADEVQHERAPETLLALVLAGTLAEDDPTRGSAIIRESKTGPSAFYGVGAQLPGGAILRAVYRDRVTIERSGAVEALGIPRAPTTSQQLATQVAMQRGESGMEPAPEEYVDETVAPIILDPEPETG